MIRVTKGLPGLPGHAGTLASRGWVTPVAHPPVVSKTVRIYGMSGNIKDAPLAPPGMEVWCINNPKGFRLQRLATMREWTRWFNMHTTRHQIATYKRGYEWFQKQTKPIYLQEVDPAIPSSHRYPREAIQEFFKTTLKPQRYFTCSGAWLIALAIYEGFERIEIWGHQMKINGEHAYQRAGFLWWIKQARDRGIEVVIPRGCIGHPKGDGTVTLPGNPDTYTGPLYGFEPHSAAYRETF